MLHSLSPTRGWRIYLTRICNLHLSFVFAVCIFEVAEDGTRKLVDHVASENLMNCLKNKREAERKYKESKEKDGVYNMTCDKVDAKVRVKEDGSWEILEILGRHEQAYERKKVYE